MCSPGFLTVPDCTPKCEQQARPCKLFIQHPASHNSTHRPVGVVWKNDMGACSRHLSRASCRRRAAVCRLMVARSGDTLSLAPELLIETPRHWDPIIDRYLTSAHWHVYLNSCWYSMSCLQLEQGLAQLAHRVHTAQVVVAQLHKLVPQLCSLAYIQTAPQGCAHPYLSCKE
jgi:hypothetical protein